MRNLSKMIVSLNISFSTTHLMNIIQNEVTDDSILLKSVITSLCDYSFSGPCSLTGIRQVCNNCIILYICLQFRKHWRLMSRLLIFLLLQFSYIRDFKLRKSLEDFLFWRETRRWEGVEIQFCLAHEAVKELFNRCANGNIFH